MKHAITILCLLPTSLFGAAVQAASPDRPADELYKQHCAICHLPGIAGAPKVGDQAEWSRRVRAGLSAVYRNAIQGMPNTAMMPNGGARDISAAELKAVVDYMLAAAKLTPETLAAAASYDKLHIANRDFIRLDANFDGVLTRTALARVKGIDLANTKVEVADGVVSITGIVEEPITAVRAHDGVKRVPGVQRIDNQLVSGHQMGWD